MLTFRSSAQAPGAWLVARLYRQRSGQLRYSVRLMEGDTERQVASGAVPDEFRDFLRRSARRDMHTALAFEDAFLRRIGPPDFAEPLAAAVAQAAGAGAADGSADPASPVAMFAITDFTQSESAWGAFLVAALDSVAGVLDAPRVEVVAVPVRYAAGARLPPALVLPIRVRLPVLLAQDLARTAWFLEDAVVARNGLQLGPVEAPELGDGDAAIVIADATRMSHADIERWLGGRDGTARLRILVNADFDPMWEPRLVRGVACLVLPTANDAEAAAWLRAFFFELTHDSALHQAVSRMRRNAVLAPGERRLPLRRWWRGPRLFADPGVDQWFRLSHALPQAAEAAASAYELGLGADLLPFAQRLQVRLGASRELDATLGELDTLHEATGPLREALGRGISFDRESSGLLPMSQILDGGREVRARRGRLVEALARLRLQPGATQALEQAQERRVDATLSLRYLDQLPYPLATTQGVPSGARVRLSVHIGQRSQFSIVVGDAPALDPLLPELEDDGSHDLDIVLLAKDFSLDGEQAATRTVRLSRFGGTVPVSWDLVAPTVGTRRAQGDRQLPDWEAGGVAELRFSIYFRNQLLQSFSLEAVLGDDYPLFAQGTIAVRCDFSQTRRFGALDQLGDRLISLALNEDVTGLHTLAVKGAGLDAASVTWDAGLLARYVEALRTALSDSLSSGGASLFPFEPARLALDGVAEGVFEAAVLRMAQAGGALYEQLFQISSPRVREMLAVVMRTRGQTIQVALLHPTYTLPWGLIYDFDVPVPEDGTPIEVCRGQVDSRDCACVADRAPRLCLRGFWGFRHVIEQLAGTRAPHDDRPGLIAQAATAPLMGFMRTLEDAYTDALSAHLHAGSARIVEYPDPRSFLGLLQDARTRPALVLYVGHQDPGPIHAPSPKLLTRDMKTLLNLTDVRREIQAERAWSVPKSLILLLGCATGASSVGTGISLAGSLLNLGAVGVLGTECTVYTDLVARIARDLQLALFAPKPIGAALREVIWRLAAEGCPLGLAFTYIGPVEAELPT